MESRTLGDYRLLELTEEREGQSIWIAEQASVGRRVRLMELTDPSLREKFLADIRAKAAVDHPLISSVYEAVDDGDCFAALEFISGSSLADRLRAREAMRPADLAHVFRRMAEAMGHVNAHHASLDRAKAAAGYEHQRLDDREEVQELLRTLPAQDAEVVRQYHIEGKSYREISSHLGIPENTIGPTLTRACDKMRQKQVGP